MELEEPLNHISLYKRTWAAEKTATLPTGNTESTKEVSDSPLHSDLGIERKEEASELNFIQIVSRAKKIQKRTKGNKMARYYKAFCPKSNRLRIKNHQRKKQRNEEALDRRLCSSTRRLGIYLRKFSTKSAIKCNSEKGIPYRKQREAGCSSN